MTWSYILHFIFAWKAVEQKNFYEKFKISIDDRVLNLYKKFFTVST